MKIVFVGSPEFAVPSLEALHASHHQIHAVVTQPDRPVGRNLQLQPPAIKVAAQRLGLSVLQPVTTKTDEFLQQIASFEPEILVVVAYGEILRKSLLELPPRGAVNLHASLLPKYRGAAPIPRAILNGETETGATTIYMNEGMDAGPILLQQTCPIDSADTTASLSRKIANLGAPLLRQTVDLIEKDAITPKDQDLTQVTYAPKLKKEDGKIDWSRNASWIARQIRAFDPWPGTFSHLNDAFVKFWAADATEESNSEPPGTVVGIQKDAFLLSCGENTVLRVRELQPENRPRLSASDFIHGYRIQPGVRFFS